MKNRLIPIALTAALFAAGAATAQTADKPATDPGVQGQASTQSSTGVANPTQKPDKSDPVSRAAVRADAVANNRSPANTMTPNGESSTRVNNQPNATPKASALTRQEVRVGALKTKPHFGERAPSAVPTNPKDGSGTPQ